MPSCRLPQGPRPLVRSISWVVLFRWKLILPCYPRPLTLQIHSLWKEERYVPRRISQEQQRIMRPDDWPALGLVGGYTTCVRHRSTAVVSGQYYPYQVCCSLKHCPSYVACGCRPYIVRNVRTRMSNVFINSRLCTAHVAISHQNAGLESLFKSHSMRVPYLYIRTYKSTNSSETLSTTIFHSNACGNIQFCIQVFEAS